MASAIDEKIKKLLENSQVAVEEPEDDYDDYEDEDEFDLVEAVQDNQYGPMTQQIDNMDDDQAARQTKKVAKKSKDKKGSKDSDADKQKELQSIEYAIQAAQAAKKGQRVEEAVSKLLEMESPFGIYFLKHSNLFDSLHEDHQDMVNEAYKEMFPGDWGNKLPTDSSTGTGEELTPSSTIQSPKKTTPDKKKKNVKEAIDLSSDINALVNGENLSEEFKEKAATIFEAAVLTRVKKEIYRLDEAYEQKLEEQVEALKDDIAEKVDAYLGYVVEQWMTENQLAVESGLKTEIVESFINGMKSLFEQHYIDVPEEKVDIFDQLAEEVAKTESKLNEQVSTNVQLRNQLIEMRKVLLIKNVTEGMTATDSEKLLELAEDISYSNDESFTKKLMTIKENYFDKKTGNTPRIAVQSRSPVSTSPVQLTEEADHSDVMQNYLRVLNRMA